MEERPMKTVKERMEEERARIRRIKRIILSVFLSLIALIVLVATLLHSPLFAIKEISIHNTGVHVSLDTIEGASDIRVGELLWRVDAKKAEEDIYRLPWIASVKVKKKLPNRVEITVTEGDIAAYMAHEGLLMAIDEQMKTIGSYSPEERIGGCPVFSGGAIVMPTVGSMLTVSQEQMELMQIFMENKEALAQVDMICLDNPLQVDMVMYTGMIVKLGNCEDLSYKLSALQEVLKQIGNTTGVLDMRMNDGKFSYRRTNAAYETEEQAEGTGQTGETMAEIPAETLTE